MTDLRPRLAAALHDLDRDRLPRALARCHDAAYDGTRAVAFDKDHVTGSANRSVPHVAHPDVLDRYIRAVGLIDEAQDIARRLGWPARAVWDDRIPQPWQVNGAISNLRSAIRWLGTIDPDRGLTLALCDRIERALRAIPVGIRQPAVRNERAGRTKAVCVTPGCSKPPTQKSRWCAACRKHRTRHAVDRIVGDDGRCVCPLHARRRAS